MEEEVLSTVDVRLQKLEERLRDMVRYYVSQLQREIDELRALADTNIEAYNTLSEKTKQLLQLQPKLDELEQLAEALSEQIKKINLRINLLQANIAKHTRATGVRPSED